MDKNFSKLVTEILSVKGWTLTRLGDKVGLSAPAIMRLRDGQTEPLYSVGRKIISIHNGLRRKIAA